MKTKHLLAAMLTTLSLYAAQAQTASYSGNAAFQRDFARLDIEKVPTAFFNGSTDSYFNYNEEKYRRFKKLRTGGIVLTSVGAGLIAGGTALIIDGNNQNGGYNFTGDYNEGDFSDGDGKIVVGAVGIVFGALSTAGGITMWAIGSKKMKKYGGGQMSVQPTKNGVGLAYKL